jgi:hypothetical protein
VSREGNNSSSEMDTHMSDLLKVRDGPDQCRNVARLCQGDAMKKGISLELAVTPTILLMVAIIVASIVPGTKKMWISQP